MRIVVTGSGGFIGRHVYEVLRAEGHDVFGVDVVDGPCVDVRLDLADTRLAVGFVAAMDVECLYHAAACAREGASFYQPCHVTATNLMAYVNTLTGAIRGGALRRVILFSSMSVYGEQFPPFDELAPKKPADVYAVNKAAMEDVTVQMAELYGFQHVIIRPHNVFGPYQSLRDRFRNVLAIWTNQIMRGEKTTVFGDGMQERAFSYITDSLPCYTNLAVFIPSLLPSVYNVGGTTPVTINHALDCVERAMGAKPNREYLQARHGEVKRAFSTYERSQRYLGYREDIGFERGVELFCAWARKQGPQEWNTAEKLELEHKRIPEHWK